MTAVLPRPASNKPLALLALAALFVGIAYLIVPNPHATSKHGAEAEMVRQCVEDHHRTPIFRGLTQPDKFYLLCHLPDGRWGLQIVQRIGEKLNEITAFIPLDGSEAAVFAYVIGQAKLYLGVLP